MDCSQMHTPLVAVTSQESISPQRIPSTGPAREALRSKGQFWTPRWLAELMAAWVTANKPQSLFDPAAGPGTFFAAAQSAGFTGSFFGFELDGKTLQLSKHLGLSKESLLGVRIADFISFPLNRQFEAIVSNPPYIRHHRLSTIQKCELQLIAKEVLGFPLDGRVGLHVYFLLKCLHHLAPNGRLAFLLPADVCEGVSSTKVWSRLCERFRLEGVLTFAPDAAPFPCIDTNVLVFLLSRNKPRAKFAWARVLKPEPAPILHLLLHNNDSIDGSFVDSVQTQTRLVEEGIATGFSRPVKNVDEAGYPLSFFAKVVRGIATGSNEFFFLTHDQLLSFNLDKKFFRRAIGRTRDCPNNLLTTEDLERLDREGRATWLLNLGHEDRNIFPATLNTYLFLGENQKLPERALIKSRRPWYKMEQRTPPPILFAYLGRRDCRFILNKAGVVPLTGFLCVYPLQSSPETVQRLWLALNHPATLGNLKFVGKSYGGGAIKVEPRQLDKLLVPQSVLDQVGLNPPTIATQFHLLEEASDS
jgi:adenine-specific DNA-methyltransferase